MSDEPKSTLKRALDKKRARDAAAPPAPKTCSECGHRIAAHSDDAGCIWCGCGHPPDCGCAGCESRRGATEAALRLDLASVVAQRDEALKNEADTLRVQGDLLKERHDLQAEVAALRSQLDALDAQAGAMAQAMTKAQKGIRDYLVAIGPHISDSWFDHLLDIGLLRTTPIGTVLPREDGPLSPDAGQRFAERLQRAERELNEAILREVRLNAELRSMLLIARSHGSEMGCGVWCSDCSNIKDAEHVLDMSDTAMQARAALAPEGSLSEPYTVKGDYKLATNSALAPEAGTPLPRTDGER